MLNRSNIFIGLMMTGSLAVASLMQEEKPLTAEVSQPVSNSEGASLPAKSVLQLDRTSRSAIADPTNNPFAGQSWYEPPPVVAPAPVMVVQEAVVPTAPNFPFTYMGRIQEEGGATVVFLTQGGQAYSVNEGGNLEDTYLLERATETQLVFVYLPLNIKQYVSVGSAFGAEPAPVALPYHPVRPMKELVSALGSDGPQ